MIKRIDILMLFCWFLISCQAPQPAAPVATPAPAPVATPAPSTGHRLAAFDPAWGLKHDLYMKAQAYIVAHAFDVDKDHHLIPMNYFIIVDFSQHADKRRFYLFDIVKGTVERHNVAAGKNSDPDGDGFATKFSNAPGSNMSSLGLYRTAETYIGAHGLSLRIDGLEDTNSNARARAVIIHPADYVTDGVHAGRSLGCPAIDPKVSKSIIDRVKGGTLMLLGN